MACALSVDWYMIAGSQIPLQFARITAIAPLKKPGGR
jgi:hypothetical protein